MKYTSRYDNSCTTRAEWWTVSNGKASFISYDEADAEKLCETLNAEVKTCDGCKYWNPFPAGYGHCGRTQHEHEGASTWFWIYGSDQGGFLGTGPKFGCVHWEAKA